MLRNIRIPAALCGVVGLKATYGRISSHGAAPLVWTVGHTGPIGATVSDVALAYAAMAGPDARDPKTQHQPPVHLDGWNRGDLEGVRLGIWDAWFCHADPDVVQSCENMLRTLQNAGATVKEIRVPPVPDSEEPAVVRFQAIKELTDSPEDVIIDYTINMLPSTSLSGDRKAVALIIRKEVLDSYQVLCQAAGLKLAALTPRVVISFDER